MPGAAPNLLGRSISVEPKKSVFLVSFEHCLPVFLKAEQIRWNHVLTSYKEDNLAEVEQSDPGNIILSHASTSERIHDYFCQLDARICRANLTRSGCPTTFSNVRVVPVQPGNKSLAVEEGAMTCQVQERGYVDKLDDEDFQLYRDAILCAYFPKLCAPDPPASPNTPSPAPRHVFTFTINEEDLGPILHEEVPLATNEDEDTATLIQAETLCDILRKAFRLNEDRARQYDRVAFSRFGKKSQPKILAEELVSQLSVLETNKHPYYNPKAFVSRYAYDQWQQWERQHITQLLAKFWHYSIPSPVTLHTESLQGKHEEYKQLMKKLLGYERIYQSIRNGVSGPRTPLSSASRRLLKEFGLRYGVGEMYRKLVYLEYLSENFMNEPWFVQHVISHVASITAMLPTCRSRMILTEDELNTLTTCGNWLHGQCENSLTRFKRLFPENRPPEGLASLIQLVHKVLELKTFLSGEELKPVKDHLMEYSLKGFTTSYERHKMLASHELMINAFDNSLCPELLNMVLAQIMKEVTDYRVYYGPSFESYFDIAQEAAKVFYKLLMEDVEILCEGVMKDTDPNSINHLMLSLAYNLHKLDKDWEEYIPQESQSWHLTFLPQSLIWISALKGHMQNLVINAVSKDKFGIVILPPDADLNPKSPERRPPPRPRSSSLQSLSHSVNSAFSSPSIRLPSTSNLGKENEPPVMRESTRSNVSGQDTLQGQDGATSGWKSPIMEQGDKVMESLKIRTSGGDSQSEEDGAHTSLELRSGSGAATKEVLRFSKRRSLKHSTSTPNLQKVGAMCENRRSVVSLARSESFRRSVEGVLDDNSDNVSCLSSMSCPTTMFFDHESMSSISYNEEEEELLRQHRLFWMRYKDMKIPRKFFEEAEGQKLSHELVSLLGKRTKSSDFDELCESVGDRILKESGVELHREGGRKDQEHVIPSERADGKPISQNSTPASFVHHGQGWSSQQSINVKSTNAQGLLNGVPGPGKRIRVHCFDDFSSSDDDDCDSTDPNRDFQFIEDAFKIGKKSTRCSSSPNLDNIRRPGVSRIASQRTTQISLGVDSRSMAVKPDVHAVKTNAHMVTADVHVVKQDVHVKVDVSGVKADVSGVKADVNGIKADVNGYLGQGQQGVGVRRAKSGQLRSAASNVDKINQLPPADASVRDISCDVRQTASAPNKQSRRHAENGNNVPEPRMTEPVEIHSGRRRNNAHAQTWSQPTETPDKFRRQSLSQSVEIQDDERTRSMTQPTPQRGIGTFLDSFNDNGLNPVLTSEVLLPISSSFLDTFITVHRYIRFGKFLFEVLLPLPKNRFLRLDRLGPFFSEVMTAREKVYEKFIKGLCNTLSVYADNIMCLDLCAVPSEISHGIIGKEMTNHLISQQNSGLIWGCRHIIENDRNCFMYVNRKAKYLADRFEPVTQQMCCRVNILSTIRQLLPKFRNQAAQIGSLEVMKKMGVITNRSVSRLSQLTESMQDYEYVSSYSTPISCASRNHFMATPSDTEWAQYPESIMIGEEVISCCMEHLQILLKGQIQLLAHRINLFLKEAISLLLSLEMKNARIEERLQPVAEFLENYMRQMKSWLYADLFELFMEDLWTYVVEDFSNEVKNLIHWKRNTKTKAELLLQAVSFFMKFVSTRCPNLSLDDMVEKMDTVVFQLQLYTQPSERLIALYYQLYESCNQSEYSSEDDDHLPAKYLQRMKHDLHLLRKCFSGEDLINWVLEHPTPSPLSNPGTDSDSSPEMFARENAENICQRLLDDEVIVGVDSDNHNLGYSIGMASDIDVSYPRMTICTGDDAAPSSAGGHDFEDPSAAVDQPWNDGRERRGVWTPFFYSQGLDRLHYDGKMGQTRKQASASEPALYRPSMKTVTDTDSLEAVCGSESRQPPVHSDVLGDDHTCNGQEENHGIGADHGVEIPYAHRDEPAGVKVTQALEPYQAKPEGVGSKQEADADTGGRLDVTDGKLACAADEKLEANGRKDAVHSLEDAAVISGSDGFVRERSLSQAEMLHQGSGEFVEKFVPEQMGRVQESEVRSSKSDRPTPVPGDNGEMVPPDVDVRGSPESAVIGGDGVLESTSRDNKPVNDEPTAAQQGFQDNASTATDIQEHGRCPRSLNPRVRGEGEEKMVDDQCEQENGDEQVDASEKPQVMGEKLEQMTDEEQGEMTDEKHVQMSDEKLKQMADEKLKQMADEKLGQVADEKLEQMADEKLGQMTAEKMEQMADEKLEQMTAENRRQMTDEKLEQMADEKLGQVADEKLEQTRDENLGLTTGEKLADVTDEKQGQTTDEKQETTRENKDQSSGEEEGLTSERQMQIISDKLEEETLEEQDQLTDEKYRLEMGGNQKEMTGEKNKMIERKQQATGGKQEQTAEKHANIIKHDSVSCNEELEEIWQNQHQTSQSPPNLMKEKSPVDKKGHWAKSCGDLLSDSGSSTPHSTSRAQNDPCSQADDSQRNVCPNLAESFRSASGFGPFAPRYIESSTVVSSSIFQSSQQNLYRFKSIQDVSVSTHNLTESLLQDLTNHNQHRHNMSKVTGPLLQSAIDKNVTTKFVLTVLYTRRKRDKTTKRFFRRVPEEMVTDIKMLEETAMESGCFG